MARNNKPVSVELIDLKDGQTEVKINKTTLGTVTEADAVMVTFADERTVKAANFDEAVAMLIADYNLHR